MFGLVWSAITLRGNISCVYFSKCERLVFIKKGGGGVYSAEYYTNTSSLIYWFTESDSTSSYSESNESGSGDEPITEAQDEVQNDLASLFPSQQNSKPEGKEIHQQIAENWSVLLTAGLEKEERSKLLASYPGVKNCPRLAAPALNLEIQACLPSSVVRQDNFLCNLQDQLGSGLVALSRPLDALYRAPTETTNALIPPLVDAARLLTDLHHTTSLHRRFLLTPHLNPEHKKILDTAAIDSKLYGETLPEIIKDSQQVKKASAELALMKASTSTAPTVNKNKQPLNFSRPKAKTRYRKSGYPYRRERSRSPQTRRNQPPARKWKQRKHQSRRE